MTAGLSGRLSKACPDRVLSSGHPRYDAVRQTFNGMYDHRPRYICLPTDADEVAQVVRAAGDAGVAVTVRGGGHHVAGAGSCDDGLVLDLRLIRGVAVDPRRRLARVGGGATWLGLDSTTARYGFATTGGTVGSTGVGGLTLGGGLGYLSRSLGLTCDQVESYDLITATGERIRVDGEQDPELNAVLRGAGHGLAVVHEFTFRLAPVSLVHGGRFVYHIEHASKVLEAYAELMAEAPDELTCLLLLEPWGEPAFPALVANVCYTGNDRGVVARAERILTCAPVVARDFQPRSYLSMQAILGETDFGLRHYWTTCAVTAFPDELGQRLVEQYLQGGHRGGIEDVVIITPLGGAIRRPAEPGVISFRQADYTVLSMAIWRDPADDERQIAWARGVARAAQPWALGREEYSNYMSDPADQAARERRRAGDPRLRSIKQRLDQTETFGPMPADPVPAGVAPAVGL